MTSVRRFKRLYDQAAREFGLAQTYLEDGALLSASLHFRKGANALDLAHSEKMASLGAPVDHDAQQRHGWAVQMDGIECFNGEAGDALMDFDRRMKGEWKTLELLTPDGHAISKCIAAGRS